MFSYLSSNKKTRDSKALPGPGVTKAYIAGCGRAIPDVDQLKGQGALVDIDIVMKKIVEAGVHNPKTGKPISIDWARRNLGTNTIAVADITTLEETFDVTLKEGHKNITEFEMSISAAEMAMKEAGINTSDIDCIFHVSGSLALTREDRPEDMGFNHCMREYTNALPGLRSDCLMYHLNSGCSGVVPPFRMAKSMLSGGDFKNILVVTSTAMQRKDWMAHTKENDLSLWINFALFGDGASAFVLRGSDNPLELAQATRNKLVFELLTVDSVTDTDFFIFQAYVQHNKETQKMEVVGRLNPDAAKQVFSDTLIGWIKKQGIKVSSLDAMLIHQPNSFIVQKLQQYVLGKKVVDVANRYGNLVAASLGTQFYEQIYQNRVKIQDGGLIAGFTLGAHAGNTYGGFTARAVTTIDASESCYLEQ